MHPDQTPRCDPSFLGSLTEDPVVNTGPVLCFEGEEKFLSKRKLDERERIWNAVASHLEHVLAEGETVLYFLPALHIPGILHQLGFGVWWSYFFRSALVLTDRRILEISMRDWKQAGTLIKSYPWDQVRKTKLSMGVLKVTPAKGRTQKWKLPVRGDRKLLKLLLPKLEEMLPIDIHVPQQTPLWHCPECGTATEVHPKQCDRCDAVFKTTRLAAALALAFPGAGLFYAGHAGLGVLDLLGEAFLYVVVALAFLAAPTTEDAIGTAAFGLFVLFLTKLESAHLATTLVRRTVLDKNAGRWRKIASAGAVASLVLIALPPVFSGASANHLDTDFDLSVNTLGWTGGHDSDDWQFGANPDQRSEWIREDGQALFVFSMPFDETPRQTEAALKDDGQTTETKLFAGFNCVRTTQEYTDDEDNSLFFVRWFLFDEENDDLHILAVNVWPQDLQPLEPEIEAAVQSASWIPLGDQEQPDLP